MNFIKALLLIVVLVPQLANSQFEFKTDNLKEEWSLSSYSYTIENSLYRLTANSVSIFNLKDGQSNIVEWDELGGEFFNKQNLKKSYITISGLEARNFEGNLQFILHVNLSDLSKVFVRVEIDKNLKLVSHLILANFKRKTNSQGHFKTNPKTKESVFIEYSKIDNGKDFWRVLFFNKENEFVSIDTFSFDIAFKNNYGTDEVTINSVFVVSEKVAVLNINERLFSIKKREFQIFEIDFERGINQYGLVSNIGGFSLVGHYTNFGQKQPDKLDTHGIVVLSFDENLNQKSIKQYPLSNNLLANYMKQVDGDFEKESFGYIDIKDIFIQSNGEIRIVANTVPTRNNGAGSIYKENIILITINHKGELVKTSLVPIKYCNYKASLIGKTSVKVILTDTPKCYDKLGKYITGCREINSSIGVLVVFEFDKLSGELLARNMLEFNNNEDKIKGTTVYAIEIDDVEDKVILNISIEKGKNHIIGVLE